MDEVKICKRDGCNNVITPGTKQRDYCSRSCGCKAAAERKTDGSIISPVEILETRPVDPDDPRLY